MNEPVGVSVLTNAARLPYLDKSISALLRWCGYRPLVIGILDNGSLDGTWQWAKGLDLGPGIELRVERWDLDGGCARGTNAAMRLVSDCRYALHLESDFLLLPSDVTGEDSNWLSRALDVMRGEGADYVYLRRIVDEKEMLAHWWYQWPERFVECGSSYFLCDGFWWSNNPALRDNESLFRRGTLPLEESLDGPKGTAGWSRPELAAKRPGRVLVHRWGLFVHLPVDLSATRNRMVCRRSGGVNGRCKYGFLNLGGESVFCDYCKVADFRDMRLHKVRYIRGMKCKTDMQFTI